jgi:hemolysin D
MGQTVSFRSDAQARPAAAGAPRPPGGGTVIQGPFPGRPGPRLTREEREFLPAALEVIETPASPTLRLSALAICALVAGGLAWATFSRIDIVAVAEGKIVPLGQVKVVQPLDTAMVRGIHVEEGDHVAAGQVLVDLDPTEVRADLEALLYNRAQAALDAEAARVLLTRNPDEPFRAPDGVAPLLAEHSRSQAFVEIEKHLSALAGLEADLAQKEAALRTNEAQIERGRLSVPLLEEKHATAKGLYDKGIGARPPVLESQQQLVDKRAELKGAELAVHQIGAEMRSLKAKAQELRAGFTADATDRRIKALQKVAQLEQEITKARQKERARRLVAPVDGTVQGIKIHTPGAVVTTADTLMTIVPDGTRIEVDALVQNRDVGFVQEGQEVEVKLDAFPFTRYGLVPGRLRKLARDAAMPAASGPASPGAAGAAPSGELAYPAKVSLLQDWIEVDGRREPIRPGMRVQAEIKTSDRRVIEYLLSPVVQAVKEAGRER